jgi:cell division protein FtsI (penicillin-binding protein 3)
MRRLSVLNRKKVATLHVGGYVGRMAGVGIALSLFMLVCLARVGYLQIVEGKDLAQTGSSWQMDDMKFYAMRGPILDCKGNVLATTVEGKGLQVFTPAVHSSDYLVEAVSGLLAINREAARKKVECGAKYCYVSRFVDPKLSEPLERILTTGAKDQELAWQHDQLSGLQIVPAAVRLYPYGALAGQVLGVARVPTAKGDGKFPSPMQLEGQYGIEAACDDLLAGRPITQVGLKRQRQGLSLLVDNPDLVLEANSIMLTLDASLQAIAEEELRNAVVSAMGKRGWAVVMDVRTGELLAVAHYPPFNPNATTQYDSEELWKWNDSAFSEILEPGSTLKPLVLAACLEEGIVSLDDLIYCENGSWKVSKRDKPIKDHGAYEFLSVADCLKLSSNICFGKLGLKLGARKLYDYVTSFGFGKKSGAKPKGMEARGLINKDGQNWTSMEVANISFGQGIAITPVQLTAAIASLGNAGKLMKPLLVKAVYDGSGNLIQKFEPEVVGRPVSPKTARQVIDGMKAVVGPGGTGERAAVFGFDVAGKTGTAQKVMTVEDPYWQPGDQRKSPARRSVYVDKWIASFAGLIPAQKPRLAILVAVDEPYMDHMGGAVAAPAFSRIASRTMLYLDELPDGDPEGRAHAVSAAASGPDPLTRLKLQKIGKALLPSGVGPASVPDFAGLTVGEALRVAWQSRVRLVAEGSGVALAQEPEAKAVVSEWGDVRVRFGRPEKAAAEDKAQ